MATNCPVIIGSTYNEIGICQQELQQYEPADTAYKLALNIRHKLGDQQGEANVYQNLMSLKIAAGHFIAADEYGKQALSVFEKIHDTLGMARVYNEYSNFFAENDDPRALTYSLKSLALAKHTKNDTLVAEICLNLGNRYYDMPRYDSAAVYYRKTLTYAVHLQRLRLQGQALNGLGLANWGLGRIKETENSFLDAIKAYRPGEDGLDISYTYNNLAQFYEQQKDYRRAKQMVDSAFVTLDVVFTQKTSREKKELEQYDLRLADMTEKVTLLKDKTDRDRWIILLISGGIILGAFTLYLRQRMKNQILEQQKTLTVKENKLLDQQKLLAEKEVERLQYEKERMEHQSKQLAMEQTVEEQRRRIDDIMQKHQQQYKETRIEQEVKTRRKIGQQLHNNIGSLLIALRNRMENMLLLLHDTPKLEERIKLEAETITKIHEETRELSKTIEKSSLDKSWLDSLKWFCDINNSAPASATLIELTINNMGEPLPSLLAEELYSIAMALIGNALKWANAPKVEVQISNTIDELTLIVSDNGDGFDEKKIKKGDGLRNVRDQVKALRGELHIDTSNGSEFIITVPLKNELPNFD